MLISEACKQTLKFQIKCYLLFYFYSQWTLILSYIVTVKKNFNYMMAMYICKQNSHRLYHITMIMAEKNNHQKSESTPFEKNSQSWKSNSTLQKVTVVLVKKEKQEECWASDAEEGVNLCVERGGTLKTVCTVCFLSDWLLRPHHKFSIWHVKKISILTLQDIIHC